MGTQYAAHRGPLVAKVELEWFSDKEVSCVYIAGGLREARRVEDVLTQLAIDYAVEVEPYRKAVYALFSLGTYAGAAFYIRYEQASLARSALLEAGLRAGIQNEEGD